MKIVADRKRCICCLVVRDVADFSPCDECGPWAERRFVVCDECYDKGFLGNGWGYEYFQRWAANDKRFGGLVCDECEREFAGEYWRTHCRKCYREAKRAAMREACARRVSA